MSLLLFPDGGNDAHAGYRSERGEALREALKIGTDTPLADRNLRNAWMHFDERLDGAILNGTFGDRHRFMLSNQASSYIGKSVILMELDTLIVHYRGRDGEHCTADLKTLTVAIDDLQAAARRAITAG